MALPSEWPTAESVAIRGNEGKGNVSSDHAILADDDCSTHVARLFSSTNLYGVVDSFLINTIVLIPKGQNANESDSTNYWGITSSPIYGKIFD